MILRWFLKGSNGIRSVNGPKWAHGMVDAIWRGERSPICRSGVPIVRPGMTKSLKTHFGSDRKVKHAFQSSCACVLFHVPWKEPNIFCFSTLMGARRAILRTLKGAFHFTIPWPLKFCILGRNFRHSDGHFGIHPTQTAPQPHPFWSFRVSVVRSHSNDFSPKPFHFRFEFMSLWVSVVFNNFNLLIMF